MTGLITNLVRLLLWINKAILIFVSMAITLIVIYQIVARTGGFSVRWTEELARFLSIWATFLAVPLLLVRQRLINIDYFQLLLPFRAQRFLLFVQICSVLVGSLALIWFGCKQVTATWKQTSPGLLWPMGLFTLPIIISSVMSLFVIPIWAGSAWKDLENESGSGTEKYQ